MTNRVCIYIRTSSGEPDQERSLKNQLQACREWCDQNGASAVLVFADAAMCAAARPNGLRPSVEQMLAMAAEPDPGFDLILAHSASRLFRDSAALKKYHAELAGAGVGIEFVIKPHDSSSASEIAGSILKRPGGRQ